MNEGVQLGEAELEAALLGGAVLGGGGGGRIEEGRKLGREALAAGVPVLVPLEALPETALIATASLVGAPASPDAAVEPSDYVRAWELLAEATRAPLAGVISCENGAVATVNGWLQAAAFGIPVVDAPADGRAHPTGDMGALGLETRTDFVSCQAASGGSVARGRHLEQQVRGSLSVTNDLVRRAAEAAGGLVAVARNPVSASYVREHAAPGAIAQALAIGRRLRDAHGRGARAVVEALSEQLGASFVVEGAVESLRLQTRGGYDVGLARIGGFELTIWNEYLTVEGAGARWATFPDLIVTIDVESALPLTSGELEPGRRVIVLTAPAARLRLGAGLRSPANYRPLESAVEREIIRYVFPATVAVGQTMDARSGS